VQQALQQQGRSIVVGDQVVLQVQRVFGQFGQGSACGEGFLPSDQQAQARVLRCGARPRC
jgi:hypothetical protein